MKKLLYLVMLCAVANASLFGMEAESREDYQPLVDKSARELEKILDKKTTRLLLYTVGGGMACGACGGAGAGLGLAACTGSSAGGTAYITTILTLGCSAIGMGPGLILNQKVSASKFPTPGSETLKNKVGQDVWWCTQHAKPLKTDDVTGRFNQLLSGPHYSRYQTDDTYQTGDDFHAHENCEHGRCKNIALLQAALCKDDADYPTQSSLTNTTCKGLLELVAKQYFIYRLYTNTQGPQALQMSAIEEE